jgi:hypothetical protein
MMPRRQLPGIFFSASLVALDVRGSTSFLPSVRLEGIQ